MREEAPQAQEQELRLSVSDKEILQKKDFAQMSAAEIAEVTRAIAQMQLAAGRTAHPPLPARCARPASSTCAARCAASLRTGGEIIDIRKLGRIDKPAPIVALLDISGSMSEYTRLFLHFLHAITDARKRVSVFLFGTRLTNVTRSRCGRAIPTRRWRAARPRWRIGPAAPASPPRCTPSTNCGAAACSGRAPSCCLISDGLEREADDKLAFEMDRLHRSCRRLIWLNPLLRYGGFEAKAQGIKMMLPHVDEFRPVHNLSSMEGLIAALSAPPPAASSQPDPIRSLKRGPPCSIATKISCKAAEDWQKAGHGVALATVVETWGSAPRPAGSSLVINDDGTFLGSVSGGCVEGAVVTEALDVIASGQPKMLEFGVADETAWNVGLSCGGTIRVFVEKVGQS